jgi:type IV secretory pathway VirB3-like protein
MKNYINIKHIIICLVFQAIGYLFTKNPFIGAIAGVFFFAGREIAQNEYRYIDALPSKLRKDMPLFGGLNPKYWTMKSLVADLTIPSLIVITIAIILQIL